MKRRQAVVQAPGITLNVTQSKPIDGKDTFKVAYFCQGQPFPEGLLLKILSKIFEVILECNENSSGNVITSYQKSQFLQLSKIDTTKNLETFF